MRHPILAAAISAAVLLLPAAAPAADSFDNSTGYIDSLPAVIGAPGTWCMRKNLSTSLASGSAVRSTVTDVVIDCHGFRILGTAGRDAGVSRGVGLINAHGSTVRNCRVVGFYTGIGVQGNGMLVEDNRVEGNGVGLSLYGAIEEATSGNGPVARRNVVQDSMYFGIEMSGAGHVVDNIVDGVVVDPRMYYPEAIGIGSIGGGDGMVVARNIVRNIDPAGGAAYGIYTMNGTNVLVRDNIVIAMPGVASNGGILCMSPGSAVGNVVTGGWGTPVSCTATAGNDVLQ